MLPNTHLFIHYSSTEASTIAYFDASSRKGKANCVGQPFPSAKVVFLDENNNLKPNTSRDDWGIIAYEGPCAMLGYWNDPELTKKVLIDGRIVMTDLGYLGDDGYIYITGRRDDVIVSGGYKIAPYEIENIAMHIPEIAECVCMPQSDDTVGFVPILYVSLKPNTVFNAKVIYDFLAERLETYKLPRAIREVESFPRIEGSVKVNRAELSNHG